MTRIRGARFVPSYKPKGKSPEFGTFGELMVSDQIFGALKEAGRDIIILAKAASPVSNDDRDGHYVDGFVLNPVKMISVVGKKFPNKRAMAQVGNVSPNAVAVEFGSGVLAAGPSKGEPRPQGGFSGPRRPLGTAGNKIGRGFE